MKQTLTKETKECLKRFKKELHEQGIKVIDIAYTEISQSSAWIFYFIGSSHTLENYLQRLRTKASTSQNKSVNARARTSTTQPS